MLDVACELTNVNTRPEVSRQRGQPAAAAASATFRALPAFVWCDPTLTVVVVTCIIPSGDAHV